MSKVKLLLNVVSDMRSLADSIQSVCDAMTENEPTEQVAPVKAKEKKAPPKVTLEDVRAVLAEKSRLGMTAEVRDIIKKYGADKLSEIAEIHYAEILKDAEGL